MGKITRFTDEQLIILEDISKTDKSTWSDQINDALPQMGDRTYSTVWQKVYSLSGMMPDYAKKSRDKKKKSTKKSGKKKLTAAEKRAKEATYKRQYRKKNKARTGTGTVYKTGGSAHGNKRKLHTSPLRGTTMRATANELRFPIQNLRIEGGELIVTFK